MTERKNKNPLLKYRNPDPRCTYPFESSFVGYCWSYANYVDDGETFLKKNKKKRFEDICMGCDLFKDSPEFNSKTWRDK